MRRAPLIVSGGIVGGILLLAVVVLIRQDDPCLSGLDQNRHAQLHAENPYVFACGDAIYIADVEPKTFLRADVDVASFEALPFRFGRDQNHLYYVARGSEWGHNSWHVLPEVDLTSLQIIRDDMVSDLHRIYAVLDNQVFVADAAGRPLEAKQH